MKVELSYEEIINYVEQNFLIRPQLVYVDERTIDIKYKPKRFLPTMSIRTHVDGCRKDVLCFFYECSVPMSMIVSGAIGHLENKIPKGVEINTADKRIVLYLDRIEVLEKPLSYVEFESISFYDNHVGVSARIK